MDEQAEYSVLSKAAYDYFHGGEALAQSELREYGLGSYGIDDGLSDEHAVVITRPDGSAVVSYRGTDHISDLVLPDCNGLPPKQDVAENGSRRFICGE